MPSHTPRYYAALPARQKFQFVFSAALYPLFALFMAVMFALSIAALLFDVRFAEVTFPAFMTHMLPSVLALIFLAFRIRADGLFRPRDAKVLGWEKAVFAALQWPWVLLGCTMALRDRLLGGFVDFRVTPKSEKVAAMVPWRVLAPYLALAIVSLLPILLVQNAQQSAGFYIFALINAALYTSVCCIIVVNHHCENHIGHALPRARFAVQTGCVLGLAAHITFGLFDHGNAALIALASTKSDIQLTRTLSVVAGAGQGAHGSVQITYKSNWFSQLLFNQVAERPEKQNVFYPPHFSLPPSLWPALRPPPVATQTVPPGPLPFGVYDPYGDYIDVKDIKIEHLFLPWEEVSLPSLAEAETYTKVRNRSVLFTIEA